MGLTPTLIEGFEVSPADFPFIYDHTVGFVSSLPWWLSRNYVAGEWHFVPVIGR